MQLSDDSGSLLAESPYIGKCYFHKNEYAVEHRVHAKPSKVQHGTISTTTAAMSQGQMDSVNIERDVISQTMEKKWQIDIELQHKICALAEGLSLL